MKKITLLILVIFLSFLSRAQHTNLSFDEMTFGVKFNNITLEKISETEGNLIQMRTLFGSSVQETPNNSGPFLGKNIFNEDIYFHFEDETDTGSNFNLSYIVVKSSSILVNVKNLSIKIGNDKSKFGGFPFSSTSNSFNFIDQETGSAVLSFKIDSTTNKVSEITFNIF